MAEEDVDSFDTAWNKYMGEQALVMQPSPEPSAAGNLLNQQESIAFSRFFDNLLAQPSSPRSTARRLDEELQKLSYAGQPYMAQEDFAGGDASNGDGGVPAPRQARYDEAGTDSAEQRRVSHADRRSLGAHQMSYGVVPQQFDQNMAAYVMQQQSYAAGGYYNPLNGVNSPVGAPYVQDAYADMTKQYNPAFYNGAGGGGSNGSSSAPSTAPSAALLGRHGLSQDNYNYAMVGLHQPLDYQTDPQFGSRLYPRAPYSDATSSESPEPKPPQAKKLRTASVPSASAAGALPIERRARPHRGESQTRLNHMNSEKRRRAHIRNLFDRMCSLVPRVSAAEEAPPKSHVLQETHNRLIELETTNASIRRTLQENGVNTSSVPIISLDHHRI